MTDAPSYAQLSQGRIEYRWFGHRDRTPTLVLLHEGLGCVDLWRAFPDELAARTGCGVLAYSRYGYGRSAPCALPRPISYMHDDARTVLPELLRHLDIGDHVLIGHSDGGSIALINAGASAAPGLRGVVTMAAHIFIEDVSVRSIAAASEAFATGRLRQALERYHGTNVDCAFRGWADSWLNPEFLHWNLEEFLPTIRVPCLVMQGETDAYGTAAQVEGIVAGVGSGAGIGGRAEALMLTDCGHAPHQDQPQATLNAIGAFVAGISDESDPE
ncbi:MULTISPECIES: alpha/beta hydrolase [unclassified Minwuia]|jgi:pimeloyl-ACP methyl ester carboxylesterase|uniref:alpha/beta fold hydrolase n=1 Tax=unclassified Minwuia TaxID=2618799 RepID=UPI00247A83C1|nr:MULTISPECIES: alpha/beta hydrolase [unclassified Minwuia]